MAARTIVTLHPDVECDVCGRRLLRGERPDVFLGGGQRRMVCELCTPRAAHEGWRREIEGQGTTPRAAHPQRSRSLLGRLRQLREPARGLADDPTGAVDEGRAEGAHGSVAHGPRRARTRGRAAEWARLEPEWTALDEQWAGRDGQAATTTDRPSVAAAATGVVPIDAPQPAQAPAAITPDSLGLPTNAPPTSAAAIDRDVARALEVFNGGETPRRIASVTRALGEACVHVVRDAERESVVAIVVAWELCWYRYELDLEDATGTVSVASEGTELEELPAEQRVANAVADEHGTLSLTAI